MHTESIAKLAEALAKAQGEIQNAIKSTENSHFQKKYADLASVWNACRAPLSKNGLAVIQTSEQRADKLYIITTLVHSSGEWIKGEYPVVASRNDAQGYGSATTYARRYALAAMVGVAPNDDDDGEAAVGRGASPAKEPTPTKKAPPSGEDRLTAFMSMSLEKIAAFATEAELDQWERDNEKALAKLATEHPQKRVQIGDALAAAYQRITSQEKVAAE